MSGSSRHRPRRPRPQATTRIRTHLGTHAGLVQPRHQDLDLALGLGGVEWPVCVSVIFFHADWSMPPAVEPWPPQAETASASRPVNAAHRPLLRRGLPSRQLPSRNPVNPPVQPCLPLGPHVISQARGSRPAGEATFGSTWYARTPPGVPVRQHVGSLAAQVHWRSSGRAVEAAGRAGRVTCGRKRLRRHLDRARMAEAEPSPSSGTDRLASTSAAISTSAR